MMREITCIVCPNGCDMEVEFMDKQFLSCTGNLCPRGIDYAKQEICQPMRTIATSVFVKGGELPLASVRIDKAIPKECIFDAMEEIKNICVVAPIQAGEILVKNVAGTDANVIVTKDIHQA